MGIAFALQAFYLTSAACILVANLSTFAQTRFVVYGPRSFKTARQNVKQHQSGELRKVVKQSPDSHFAILVEALSNIKVPHSWFIHFYVLSVGLSALWGQQMFSRSSLIRSVSPGMYSSMTMPQVTLLWAMMLIQGTRRMFECFSFNKKSSSTMWIAHWAIGLAFYVATSVAVWIEGIPAIESWDASANGALSTVPTSRACIAILLFLFASGIQHDCHAYLASLEKYTLPVHPFFKLSICPHYTAECVIYLSMAIAGAPAGSLLNRTLTCALLFVIVNLGVTAAGTRQWYEERFGPDTIKGRWVMMPGIW